MKYDSLLPIGSVVKVQDFDPLLLVIGSNVSDPVSGRVYDYCACIYPAGYISEDQIVSFDHAAIEEIYAVGYLDEESRTFQHDAQELNQYLRDSEKGEAENG
ncbi:MAG: DUF4176 domain-containing protein [Lachnospiraceae bacterium]|nr:DUF4176 domain-containing protein [Lachnospiraceae bacterium]MBR2996777.1 DUF4176 domain-containing protein [Lachnospiraceae bacterium]